MGEEYLESFTDDLLNYYKKKMFSILSISKVPRVRRKSVVIIGDTGIYERL